MARTSPHDDDDPDDDRPRRKAKSGGMPVWGWVLLGIGGLVFVGGGLVCAGMLWMGKKAADVVEDVTKQNAPSQQMGLEVDKFVLQEPEEPVTITANIRLHDYYNWEYSDRSKFYSFKMTGDRQTLNLWAIRGSSAGERIYAACKDTKLHTVTLKIHRVSPDGTPTPKGRPGTLILDVVKTDE